MEPNHQRIAELETQVHQLSQLLGAKFNELNSIRQELEKLKVGNSSVSPAEPALPLSAVPVTPEPTSTPAVPSSFTNKPL